MGRVAGLQVPCRGRFDTSSNRRPAAPPAKTLPHAETGSVSSADGGPPAVTQAVPAPNATPRGAATRLTMRARFVRGSIR